MTIANVSTGKFADTNGFSLTPGGTGHFILLTVTCTDISHWATGISNSGNVTWTVLVSHQVFGTNNAVTQTVFLGQVNSTAAQAQTVAFNAGSPGIRVGWQEFSTTAGFSSITLDATGTTDTLSSGHFPAVTPTRSGDTYWSFIWDNGTGVSGSTSGFTYAFDSVHGNLQCYNASCANATQTPNIGDTADGTAGIGVMFYEAAGASVTGSGGLAVKKGRPAGSGSVGGSAGSGGLAVKKAAPAGSGTAASPPGMTHFPFHKLGLKVELLLNTTWTDVTAFVRTRDPVSISPFGRTNETSSMQPAQLALTLDNRTGRFTPGNSLGAYYPYVQLNTRIRVSVNDTSVTGAGYSGYRFWGEASSWPATWDESGRDVYAQVTAYGIWRRLSQSTKTLGSPYTRYNNINVRGAWTLASYWPMEDGQNSKTLANLVAGQAAMTVVTTQQPNLASCTAFPGSDAIPVLNASELSGTISTTANPTNVLWRFTLFVPSGGDTGVAAGTVARMHTSGTVASVDVKLGPAGGGPITITGANSGGTTLFTGSSSLTTFGTTLEVQVGLAQSGGNVVWSLRTMLPGGTGANSTVTGSVAGTVDDSTSVIFSPGATWKGTAVGQSVVIYGNPNVVDSAQALAGWSGEYAGARFLRVCAEQGIAATLAGSATSGTTMGPQADDTLANVLGMIEATDGGQLFETRSQFGLGYRTKASMTDQSPALTLNHAARQLFTSLTPVNDDTLTHNDIVLTNYDGYAVRVYLAAGARSVQDPPNGAGSGYEYTRQVSAATHAQVDALGEQLLGLGTVTDNRYPTVTVNLAAPGTAPVFSAVPAAGIGDY
ncbi:MAG TPA: hypothetical protein VGH57_03850, partial [Amycolatopsis sp.]